MAKTVLFVTYGGGHARMVVPVVRALAGSPDIKTVTLAATLGGPIFKSENLPYLGYKDFLRPEDTKALEWGKKLASIYHSPESGIDEAESIAYLGLSYVDMVTRLGEKEAAELFESKGRHAFLQLTVMERVLDDIQPDIVVTTNSPKSEQAVVEVANKRGIPTLSMVDLFGIHHFHPLESDYIAIICERVIENLEKEDVHKPRDAYLVTGNPAFDSAYDYRGAKDYAWRREHFPQLPDSAKTLLWIDMPAYWNLKKRELHVRSNAEIIHDLDDMAAACKDNGAYLLVRPHPSQPREIYDSWLKEKAHAHVFYAGTVPLYPLLKSVDVVATYTSTVSVEALLMQRSVIQLKYQPGKSDMPLGEWGLALMAESPAELSRCLGEALADDDKAAERKALVERLLPQEKAGPKVARCIEEILAA